MGKEEVIGFVVFITVIGIFIITREFMKFKLKKEQIKADAMIKSEEIRAKNQLDIEKLIIQDKANTAQSVKYVETDSNQDEALSERRNRLNERM